MPGLKGAGAKIFSDSSMAVDLAQTSSSTVPSADIEPGDKVSVHSSATLTTLVGDLVARVDQHFGRQRKDRENHDLNLETEGELEPPFFQEINYKPSKYSNHLGYHRLFQHEVATV